MKVTNGEIYATKDSLQKLVDGPDMPIKYGLPILKLVKKLNDEIQIIDQARNILIKKYGKEVDKKITVSPLDEGFADFVSEATEMFGVEVELDIAKAKVPDTVALPVKDIAALEPFIEIIELK